MRELRTIGDYKSRFADSSVTAEVPVRSSRATQALLQALDIRKFEIELYWKRTAYFWTLIAAAFAGFFALQGIRGDTSQEAVFIVCCIGVVFSIGWYFVNRGSKYWQNNWERHVDLLEDEVIGPLYKTTIDQERYKFFHIFSAFPFSVSRINQILSLFIVAVWILLLVRTALSLEWLPVERHVEIWVIALLTLISVLCLRAKGVTKVAHSDRKVDMEMRVYE